NYLHCPTGCDYFPQDVADLATFVPKATGPVRLLISHGPPLQAGAVAIDRITEGANVGDPSLAEFMKKNPGVFPFGMFGNILEAGGYATYLVGTTRIAQEQYADSLYLNPGPIDSVR